MFAEIDGQRMLVSAEPGEWYEVKEGVKFLILHQNFVLPKGYNHYPLIEYRIWTVNWKEYNTSRIWVPSPYIARQITDPEELALLALQRLGD